MIFARGARANNGRHWHEEPAREAMAREACCTRKGQERRPLQGKGERCDLHKEGAREATCMRVERGVKSIAYLISYGRLSSRLVRRPKTCTN